MLKLPNSHSELIPDNWLKYLKTFLNKTLVIDGKAVIIKRIEFSDETLEEKFRNVIVESNLQQYVVPFFGLKKWCQENCALDNENSVSKYTPGISNNSFSAMRDIIMNNITLVQSNKEYIPQAVAIKGQVDTFIDLAKTEIDFVKTLKSLEG